MGLSSLQRFLYFHEHPREQTGWGHGRRLRCYLNYLRREEHKRLHPKQQWRSLRKQREGSLCLCFDWSCSIAHCSLKVSISEGRIPRFREKYSFAGPSQKRIGQSWVFQPCPDRKHFLLQAMTSSCQVTNMSWISNVRLKGCETTLTSALSMKLPKACSEGDLVSIICWILNKQNALGSFRGCIECNLYIQSCMRTCCSHCTATTFLHITEGRVQSQAHAKWTFVI